MKTRYLVVFAALVALLAGVSAFAQSPNGLRVNVPFAFLVDGQKLPADTYKIEQSTISGLVTLYGLTSHRTATVLTSPDAPRLDESESRLTFERKNGESYLVRVLDVAGDARIVPVHPVK